MYETWHLGPSWDTELVPESLNPGDPGDFKLTFEHYDPTIA